MFGRCCNDHDSIHVYICVVSLLPLLWSHSCSCTCDRLPCLLIMYIPIYMEVHCQSFLVPCMLSICYNSNSFWSICAYIDQWIPLDTPMCWHLHCQYCCCFYRHKYIYMLVFTSTLVTSGYLCICISLYHLASVLVVSKSVPCYLLVY